MKQIGNKISIQNISIIKHKGDGFLYKDIYGDLHTVNFVCPNCGLIQQYIPEDELKYLDHI